MYKEQYRFQHQLLSTRCDVLNRTSQILNLRKTNFLLIIAVNLNFSHLLTNIFQNYSHLLALTVATLSVLKTLCTCFSWRCLTFFSFWRSCSFFLSISYWSLLLDFSSFVRC